jgi:quinol monooxygenase YgiN
MHLADPGGMVTISKSNEVVTLINVFTVDPSSQRRLVDMLVDATETVMQDLPGFVSATIHASLDGTRVTNYAQWRRREDFEAMLQNPAARAHMQPIAALAQTDAHLYEVAESISREHAPTAQTGR